MMFWNFADKYPGYATTIILVALVSFTVIIVNVIGIFKSLISPSPSVINTCNCNCEEDDDDCDEENDEDEDEEEDDLDDEGSVIIGCYTLELYCNGDPNCRFTLSKSTGANESAVFTGDSAKQTRTKARKAGWKLNLKEGSAICPDCQRRMS
ncbi:MAG: hypothetical protein WC708_00475 [Lentisphaeria bacterium]|jgi:hypothetical protein